jgi:hypothetical protein
MWSRLELSKNQNEQVALSAHCAWHHCICQNLLLMKNGMDIQRFILCIIFHREKYSERVIHCRMLDFVAGRDRFSDLSGSGVN